jgi:ankyrin repeat protein
MSNLRLLIVLALAALLATACSEPERPTINLYRAIHAGDLDQIKRHLYWGTDVNRAGADGDYPLHVAARRGRVVIAEELLDHGADVDAVNAAGRTPLEVALTEGKTQLAEVLRKRGADDDVQSLLFRLVRDGVSDRDTLDFVVEHGADVNRADDTGSTALHLAVAGGHLLVVKRLIGLGAEVNAEDAEGRTALALAQAGGARDIAALLELYGARAQAESKTGE